MTGAAAEAAFSAASILWIIFAALAIHEYQLRSGAIETFRSRLAGMTGERHVGILLIVWFFALSAPRAPAQADAVQGCPLWLDRGGEAILAPRERL